MKSIMVEGQTIGDWFLQVDKQPEVGKEAYDKGAEMLIQFFHEQLPKFMEPDLMPEGKKIIDCCLNGGTPEDYCSLIEAVSIIAEN